MYIMLYIKHNIGECWYLISTASLMDNGCLGIQGLQFAKPACGKHHSQKAWLARYVPC